MMMSQLMRARPWTCVPALILRLGWLGTVGEDGSGVSHCMIIHTCSNTLHARRVFLLSSKSPGSFQNFCGGCHGSCDLRPHDL